MSLLGTIFSKIFPAGHPATTATTAGSTPASSAAEQTTARGNTPAAAPATGSSTAASSASAGSAQQVDVEAVLNGLAQKNPQKLNWRTSIVDLMKLVGMDSSLDSRKALARELGYNGDMNDSASMNIWLHEQVMRKIAENGGKLPADLKH